MKKRSWTTKIKRERKAENSLQKGERSGGEKETEKFLRKEVLKWIKVNL